MVTVSSPPPRLMSASPGEEDVDVRRMDDLLEKLKKNMVELIVQGDDVTRQMWHMHSVFEEIFGHPSSSTGERPLKKVVVGDRIRKAAATPEKKRTPADDPSSASPERSIHAPPRNKVFSTGGASALRASPPSFDRPSDTSSAKSETRSSVDNPALVSLPTSNPLLNTIGHALATSNPDSDDSDLDVVYQQLRCRGRHQRPEQVRVRTHRSTHQRHHRQQVASSDPESIGYAGSNSIDSGYKSLCATPEVSDGLPEVRRSASDVSASDSSTTSGRPKSLDGGDGSKSKIKMGTRSVAGKARLPVDDVTLDHLMYLRQSLRKEAQRWPSECVPSSMASYRDSSDLSPRNEEWQARYPYHSSPFAGGSRGGGEDVEGGGESSSDFLLGGAEYYDLESIQEFPPPASSYVTMLEEKTRRFRLISAAAAAAPPPPPKCATSLYRKRSESTQSVYGMVPPSRQRHRHHHATDSKLTEAAIRVLEMIEDFRVGETRGRRVPDRLRKRPGPRPASTGSLLPEHDAYAEHHVCEEILYDLAPPDGGRQAARSRLLPVPPPHSSPHHHHHHHQQPHHAYAVDPRHVVVRSSHKQQQRSGGHRFLEWHHRDNLPSDFPV